MENADVVVVSSKGQVVIPQGIRRKLRIGPKSKLLVYPYSNALVMKKLEVSDAEKELESIFKTIDARRKEEISEQELNELVQRYRHGKADKGESNANRSGHKRSGFGSAN